MKGSDRNLLVGIAIVGLVAAFWFLVLSPKREEAKDLEGEVTQLEAAVAEQEQLAAAAEEARGSFGGSYRRLVALGKAVPDDDDTASLFVQLGEIAEDSGVEFKAIQLADGTAAEVPAPAAAETTTDQAEGEAPADESGSEAAPAPVAVPPVEAAVAGLPIGATAGPAGLPVMPYSIELSGTFFELADFLDGVDALVRPRGRKPRVNGRLVTIDGFGLSADPEQGFPKLTASLAVTTFVTPPDQGLTAGASPAGPAVAIPTSDTPMP
ncbi:MAG TPA: hypothetical protein VK919_11870 [Solirubrobacterales bacterium]|nr:hypothetical protein [Solirubrobacterales bacterium]